MAALRAGARIASLRRCAAAEAASPASWASARKEVLAAAASGHWRPLRHWYAMRPCSTVASPLKGSQLTRHVLMVDPRGFRSNEETKEDNKFMSEAGDGDNDIADAVMEEWRSLVKQLEAVGVKVMKVDGQGLPDEVFPNNWFSTHSEGRLVLYPMKVPSRQKEVRQDLMDSLRVDLGYNRPTLDLSGWSRSGVALEGTGSLVLDRPGRVAYLARSARADGNLGELWAKEMGYELIAFSSHDRSGSEIYHTNVLMSVGDNFAVICADVITDEAEKKLVLDSLRKTGKLLIQVSLEQMESFACNCIQLQGEKGTVLAISTAGWGALDDAQRATIKGCVDHVVTAEVPIMERLGGGSVRCMIAELFPSDETPENACSVCRVQSEWANLDLVLVHEPGLEVDAVIPWTLDTMKVDECFNRVELKDQHRVFSDMLRSRGATVLHVRDLLNDIAIRGDWAKRELFEAVWGEEFVNMHGLANLNVEHLTTGHGRRTLDFDVPPLMNLFFMRDPAFAVPGGWVVISRPYYSIRQMESRLLRAIFRLHPALKDVSVYDGLADDPDVNIEGGDVLVADRETVLVGISQRTNEAGANKLAEFLFQKTPVTRVVKVFIPKQRAFMHLDTLFTFVNKRVVLTMPYFWSKPQVYAEVARRVNTLNEKMGSDSRQAAEDWVNEPPRIEVLEKLEDGRTKTRTYNQAMAGLQAEGIIEKALFVCGPEGSYATEEEHVARALTEQWNDAANVFCIAPNTVIAYKWCTRTVQHLQDNGVDVMMLDGFELMKGRGGARCMTMPLRRSSHKRATEVL